MWNYRLTKNSLSTNHIQQKFPLDYFVYAIGSLTLSRTRKKNNEIYTARVHSPPPPTSIIFMAWLNRIWFSLYWRIKSVAIQPTLLKIKWNFEPYTVKNTGKFWRDLMRSCLYDQEIYIHAISSRRQKPFLLNFLFKYNCVEPKIASNFFRIFDTKTYNQVVLFERLKVEHL